VAVAWLVVVAEDTGPCLEEKKTELLLGALGVLRKNLGVF